MNTCVQHRHWVRISSVCNNSCIFCLDSDAQDGSFVDDTIVLENISAGYRPGCDNRLILSGGEASINPRFAEYIRYGRELGYDRIQTVTNGNRFADLDFCQKVFGVGLQEVTFSMHGHTESLHDRLVGTPGAFRRSIQGIVNIKKHFPEVILNIDVVVNRLNVRFLPDIIRFYMRLGIMEFDILQIIPFGRGFSEHREELFYDPIEMREYLRDTWELSKIPGVHMWTNRFPAETLEDYEVLIQDPKKIVSEVMGEGRHMFQGFIEGGKKPHCWGDRCDSCFLRQYCHDFVNVKDDTLAPNLDVGVIGVNTSGSNGYKYLALRGCSDVEEMREIFGQSPQEFVEFLKNYTILEDAEVLNIPRCIRESHNNGCYEDYGHTKRSGKLEEYTENYIGNFYRKKSLRCQDCRYNDSCRGIHVDFIRAYGFQILQPIR